MLLVRINGCPLKIDKSRLYPAETMTEANYADDQALLANTPVPMHGHTTTSRSAMTYIDQLSTNTGCTQEDLPGAIYDQDKWRERDGEKIEGETRDSAVSA